MALIQDLEDNPNPNEPLSKETRRLIDLALYMSGSGHENGGITSAEEDGELDLRPLHEGGGEAWMFIRKARQKAWEKAGLDPSVLSCPRNADDINFGNSEAFEETISSAPALFGDDSDLASWPQMEIDWENLFGNDIDDQLGDLPNFTF